MRIRGEMAKLAVQAIAQKDRKYRRLLRLVSIFMRRMVLARAHIHTRTYTRQDPEFCGARGHFYERFGAEI